MSTTETKSNSRGFNKDLTIVEKYQQNKNQSVAIRPYFDEQNENMGLEKYNMTLFDGVFHHESLACLEQNGIKRYVTGLNEFAPAVKKLPADKRAAKVKEIRKVVAQLEAELATNVIDPEDADFWNKVQVLRPDNGEFWDKISIKVGNEPLFLDPAVDPYDLIKIYSIEAGGFSIVAKDLEACKLNQNVRFYLDRVKDSVDTRTKVSKVRNRALASLQNLYDSDTTKLLYTTKVVDGNSTQDTESTPVDVLYENMDRYINGNGIEKSKKKAAEHFLSISNESMQDLKIRAMIKDSITHNYIQTKADGFFYDDFAKVKIGKRPGEILEFMKNPANDETLTHYLNRIEEFWNE